MRPTSIPLFKLALFTSFHLSSGTLTISDPGDYVDLSLDASDNALLADWNITAVMYQTFPIIGPYFYNASNASTFLAHELLSVDSNDTSVVVVTEGAEANISDSTILKYGYASNLYQSSFFGANAAVNVANGSSATLSKVNVTTHNGAANVYAYGTGTVVYVEDSDLYSSGPVAHGLYASGNGTIIGTNVRHYSGGYRSSAFAGDSPGGYIYVYDSEAHTAGIGSGIFYALGEIHATNVIGLAENAPTLFMDGIQTADLRNVDLTAGLLGGTILFSSSDREAGAQINFTDSRLSVKDATGTAPGLWFGNTIATARLVNTEINTTSGILVVANYSQVTQDFDYYAGYPDNNNLAPAEATVIVQESSLVGDLVAYNGSSISWTLSQYSSWTGTAYSENTGSTDELSVTFGVYLDKTSNWTLTNDTWLTNFTDADSSLGNVYGNGFNIYYDGDSVVNKWLGNKTIALNQGGHAIAA